MGTTNIGCSKCYRAILTNEPVWGGEDGKFICRDCLPPVQVSADFSNFLRRNLQKADAELQASEICKNCQWFYQSNGIRRFQIANPGKMCRGQCRHSAQYQANGKDPAPFPELYADGYCGAFTRLEYPLPYPSAFPPPKPTSLERWLTVANTEKYTVGNPREELLAKAASNWLDPSECDPIGDLKHAAAKLGL